MRVIITTLLLLCIPLIFGRAYAGTEVCPDGLDNVHKLACMSGIRDSWREELEKAVLNKEQDIAQMTKAYKEAGSLSDDEQVMLEFRASQESFLDYMDKKCRYERVAIRGASMAGHREVGCQIEMLRQRVEEIQEYP